MLRLVFLSGSAQGLQSQWDQAVVRVGRAPDCDLRLDAEVDLEVSGHHADLVREGDDWLVVDAGSTNGTFVNGDRVERRKLASGDLLLLGATVAARVEISSPDAAPHPPAVTLRTPAPATRPTPAPAPSPLPAARADTEAARVAGEATWRLALERSRAGGGASGKTALIVADAVAQVQQATQKRTGRRWKRVVAIVAGVGLLAAAVLGGVVWQQRRVIRQLVAAKAHIDREIAAVQKAMAGETDSDRLAELEQRLDELAGNAESTVGELARQDERAARELEEAGDDLDRAIRRILQKFDAPTYAVPPVFKEALKEQVEVLAGASNLKFVYQRRNRHWPAITREFSALGLPEEMAYIAWAETQFDADAVSSAGAKGMWQMTAGTARELGLRVDDAVDERLDVGKQTRAAARKLANLLAEFGADSFMLALASYNRGEAGVRRALRQGAQEKDGFRKAKRDFWHLYRMKRLPTETMDYVPRVLAAAVVCGDPKRYGLEPGP